jgi:uroporphyrinogen-III decarboxylase
MQMKSEFKCQSDDFEQISSEVIQKSGVRFPEMHTNSHCMALLAKEIKNNTNNKICIIPFCTTVEAEALGGIIKLGDEKVGPRVKEYVFKSIEDLNKIEKINLKSERIKQVLDCTKELSGQGEIVSLNVEGPFTIISSLIDPMIFYRCLRKDKKAAQGFLKIIEDSIVEYIEEGVKSGAKIISYGDPVGSIDIVGPKVYENVSGKITYNILKRIQNNMLNSIVHLCGRTSTAFERLGLSESSPIEFDDEMTYGEAICRVIDNRKDVKIIGNACIKRSRVLMKKPIVWSISLK